MTKDSRRNLKPLIVDLKAHSPILPFNDSKDYAHFLKPQDIENVAAVVKYCQDANFDIYLRGGVVIDHLETGSKAYSDVDLIAVGNNKDFHNLTSTLSLCSENTGYIFDANSRLFKTVKTRDNLRTIMYLNIMVNNKSKEKYAVSYDLIHQVPFSGGERSLPGSKLDLSIITKAAFDDYFSKTPSKSVTDVLRY